MTIKTGHCCRTWLGTEKGKPPYSHSVMFAAAQGGSSETDKKTGGANPAWHRKQDDAGKEKWVQSSKSSGLADSRAALQLPFLSFSLPPFSL